MRMASPETTDLERRVLAHERILQALIAYMARTEPRFIDHLRARFVDATRTASQTLAGRHGVCRDFTHLAIAFCRCMNIPARYCTGYLSDIGEPEPFPPGDFAAWMEVYLGGRWWVFDPRNNTRRKGRILIGRGRDAADVPLTQTFGPNTLTQFEVWTWGARHDPAEAPPVSRD